MNWTGSGEVSGGDTNGDSQGDDDFRIDGITSAGGNLRINEITTHTHGTRIPYNVNMAIVSGVDLGIQVNGGAGAAVNFTVDLIGNNSGSGMKNNPNTYRSMFFIEPNDQVTSIVLNAAFDDERFVSSGNGFNSTTGLAYGSNALSWTNAATVGEAMNVTTRINGISINGGNLSNANTGGSTVNGRTAGTLVGISGNTYEAVVDGTQNQNNHGIWSLEGTSANGLYMGQTVTFTPVDGQFDGVGSFTYTFDGVTPEPGSAILAALLPLLLIIRRRR